MHRSPKVATGSGASRQCRPPALHGVSDVAGVLRHPIMIPVIHQRHSHGHRLWREPRRRLGVRLSVRWRSLRRRRRRRRRLRPRRSQAWLSDHPWREPWRRLGGDRHRRPSVRGRSQRGRLRRRRLPWRHGHPAIRILVAGQKKAPVHGVLRHDERALMDGAPEQRNHQLPRRPDRKSVV